MGRHLLALAVAVAVALGTITFGPPPALADSEVPVSATSTYELLPDRGQVKVTVVIKITNRIANTTRTVPCGGGTCRQTTQYYINDGWVWVEKEATDLKVVADRGTVTRKVDDKTDYHVSYKLRFQSIFRGSTRTLTVTYVIPGGAPRSDSPVRAGKAFASFCGISQPSDTASVRVLVPTGYEMTQTGGDLTMQEADDRVTYESGKVAKPEEYWFCLSGTDPTAYVTTTTTSPSGQAIILEGWPEDTAWMTDVQDEAGRALARLEGLFGLPVPGQGDIVVREVAAEELGSYSGFYTTNERLALIGEDYDVEGLVTHELSHAWFNERTFSETWLSEGYAGWAEHAGSNGDVARCRPLPYPGTGQPRILLWKYVNPRSTEEEQDLVDYQYAAACDIVSRIADRIGEERMQDVLGTLADGSSPYAGAGEVPARAAGPRSWRAWLDAVDERGMVPAGHADLGEATDLLLSYGAIVPASVTGREEARTAYHELVASTDGWAMPAAVRAPMTSWDWDEAADAIEAITAADAAVDDVERTMPDVDATKGPVRAAVEEASTIEELTAARELAESQARAAAEVAAMLEAVGTPREPLEELGLFEVDFAPMTQAAVAALVAADEDAANAEVARAEALLDDADDVGMMRLAAIIGAIAGVIALLALAVFLVRRRRRGVPAAVVADVVDAGDPADESVGPESARTVEAAAVQPGETATMAPSEPAASPDGSEAGVPVPPAEVPEPPVEDPPTA